MIKYQLVCARDHDFEGWFKDGASFDAQAQAGEIACPLCGDQQVRKAPMAPRLNKTRGDNGLPEVVAQVKQALAELRSHVEKTHDYVGDRFPEEARKIHYGETEARPIYGEASREDAEALQEEGVEIAAIPWVPDTKN